jgi:hypothetical protein
MGAGASIESTGNIYNAMPCGCIYRCEYRESVANGNVALVKCCYSCLEKLKCRTFDYRTVDDMRYATCEQSIHALTSKMGWMTEVSAFSYAHTHGIRSVEEFIYNTNILAKYGFDIHK